MGQLALLADDLVAAKRKVLAYLAQRALDLGPDSLRVVTLIRGSYACWSTWELGRLVPSVAGVTGGLGSASSAVCGFQSD